MKDETAALCSGLCLIHCIATPILLSMSGLGLIGSLFASEWVHVALFAPIALLALTSLPSGWKRHQRWLPSVAGFTGLLLLAAAMMAPHEAEAALSIGGGLLLIGGHLSNRFHCRRTALNEGAAC
ncbi:MerC domain-containing protein [Gilvimarinus agarilyticus]|uniref:MerC domain-containing protein n=1 Tax=unclassified Gilvimarinus TaxID=2642066 RepID=UPI001C08DC12|nr:MULTISPECIES: MerC domain-containing protein [unclassified Gilvimarinus]MBU2884351.1 MerC domain-containing protein [Gilvimarinus agarilyticus]MDO6569487.1 MerC domain-containing protein [Gilvimarinus sp. 2_MG-2023]MDO6748176.1 MerC domain-containing protein [Gilvimarinus sp. 1_MG-2023]